MPRLFVHRAGSGALSSKPALRGAAGAVLSVRGAGPYRIGARRTSLAARGLLGWTQPRPGQPGLLDAGPTGGWIGVVLLVFRQGRLVEVGTATAPPYSPAGASVGMSFDQLAEIYRGCGRVVRNRAGQAAYLVRVGSRVELFSAHPIRPGVGYFQAGLADIVEDGFRRGAPC